MYENFYDLKLMPFQITTDPRFLWLGEKHSEALATLKYGILENKGFLLLTGDVGTGKTALINRVVETLNSSVIVAKIPDPGLSSQDFFQLLAVELKLKIKFDTKGQFLIFLKRFLHKAHSDQKKVLLIVDEAQQMDQALLEQIRLLSNIEMQNRKLINIFFVGQPEFREMLMEDRNRAVRQRIAVSYHIDPLTESETRSYIIHRLKVAGAKREIFNKGAVRRIYSFSGGFPRLINIICDHAMLTGYASGLRSIDEKVISECERELQLPLVDSAEFVGGPAKGEMHQNKDTDLRTEKPSVVKRTGLLAAIIMLLVFGIYIFDSQKFDDLPRWIMEKIAPQKSKEPLGDITAKHNTRRSVDEDSAGKIVRRQIVTDQKSKNIVMNETREMTPLVERKFIIYFKQESNELPDQSYETLDRIAAFMKNNPKTTIDIKGYTDSEGSDSDQKNISDFRANVVKVYLLGKGVGPNNVEAVGLGSENQIATNTTEEGRSRNRRVELELTINQ